MTDRCGCIEALVVEFLLLVGDSAAFGEGIVERSAAFSFFSGDFGAFQRLAGFEFGFAFGGSTDGAALEELVSQSC